MILILERSFINFISLYTNFSPDAVALSQSIFGILIIINLISTLPYLFKFFCTSNKNGFIQNSWLNNIIFSTPVITFLGIAWLGFAVLLTIERFTLIAVVGNFVVSTLILMPSRANGLTLGLAAPGAFMWLLGWYFFLFEGAEFLFPDTLVPNTVLLVLRVHLALIFIDAGLSKFVTGFYKKRGTYYALLNPMWCYWNNIYSKFSAKNIIFKFYDYSAFSFQVIGGICLLIPQTRLIGVLLITLEELFKLPIISSIKYPVQIHNFTL